MADTTAPIFLVDDTGAHRTLIKRALKQANIEHPILEADSLADARSTLSELAEVPAIIVLDLNLGDGRGTTLLAELRKETAYANVPILILSTSYLESDVSESLSLGANSFLTKADDVDTFRQEIAESVRFWLGQG